MTAFRSFMTGLIDYAGLFPPAQLEMGPAVLQYAEHKPTAASWMLGRFICPVSRLDAFESTLNDDLGADFQPPWELSALIGPKRQDEFERLLVLEDTHEGRIAVPAVELKVANPDEIEHVLDVVPDNITVYFELPLQDDFRGLVTAIAGSGHAAKIRTGGVTADLFPSIDTVARFIVACQQCNVPFKATAGLHHPIRHFNESVNTTMHGFLNVFGAAIACRTHNLEVDAVARILESENASDFEFADDSCRLLDWTLTAEEIDVARTQFARSYGSCSFNEPLEDLQSINLLSTSH